MVKKYHVKNNAFLFTYVDFGGILTMEVFYMTVEDKVKALVLNRYRSLRGGSHETGIPQSTFERMFRTGFANASFENISKLCAALGISTDDINDPDKIPDVPKLYARIKLLLDHYNISATEAAMGSSIPIPTLERVLRDKRDNTRPEYLERLAYFFNVSVGQLLGLEPLDFKEPEPEETPEAKNERIAKVLKGALAEYGIEKEINPENIEKLLQYVAAGIDLIQ